MWTDIFWLKNGIYNNPEFGILNPIVDKISPRTYNKTEELIENYNNIQNKFAQNDFMSKYKGKDYSSELTVGSYWVNTYSGEFTIYVITDIKDNKVTKKDALTGSSRAINTTKFLAHQMPIGLIVTIDENDKVEVTYHNIYGEDDINIYATNPLPEEEQQEEITSILVANTDSDVVINNSYIPLTINGTGDITDIAVKTVKLFNTEVFTLGATYRITYIENNESTTYETILISLSEKELVFTGWDVRINALIPIPVYPDLIKEEGYDSGWEIYKI